MDECPTLPFDEPEPPEEWRSVVGYEGLYAISSWGRVRSFQTHAGGKRGGLLKQELHGRYYKVQLYRTGKATHHLVHALVAEAFIGPRPEGQEVRHGPAGSRNNRRSNLSYGTHRQNVMDRHRDGTMIVGEANNKAKLTAEKVRAIRQRVAAGENTLLLAHEYGVSRPAINYVVNRTTWKHVA